MDCWHDVWHADISNSALFQDFCHSALRFPISCNDDDYGLFQ